MQTTENRNTEELYTIPAFLTGGGEMGALVRAYDWSETALGSFDKWPQSLRTSLSIILNSRFPMFLFWGTEHICFYNDAYRPSLGNNGKHPNALGKPGVEVWEEIWPSIKPLIDQVLEKSEASWSEDQLLPIYRNGKLEDAYWTFSYSPVIDESGKPNGVFVACTETTEKVINIKKLTEAKDMLDFAINAAELGTWDLNPVTGKFTGNTRLKEWFGLEPWNDIELQVAVDAIAEKDRDAVSAAIRKALQYSSGGHYEIEYSIINPKTKQGRIVRAKGKALFDDKEQPYRFNGTLQDITLEVSAKEETQKLLTLVDNSVDLMSILGLDGKNSYINAAGRALLGIDADADVSLIPITAFHTPEQIKFVESEIIPTVMANGRWAGQFAIRNGKTGEIIPLFNNCHRIDDIHTGQPIGVGAIMRDMRPELNAQQVLIKNEERLNIAIDTTELGMYEIDIVNKKVTYNDRYLEILGFSKNEIPSQTDLLKHVHPDDSVARDIAIRQSLETGRLDAEFRVIHPDHTIRWIKVKGKVFYDEFREPTKRLGTIMDITTQKNALEDYRLSTERFRLLADSMPQFVWTGDTNGNLNYFSKAVYDYSGLSPEQMEQEGWLQMIHPDDREENIRLWMDAVTTGKDFLFEHRFRKHDGEYSWQLSRALPQRNEEGTILMWVGTSTDIHAQKVMSKNLEQKVRERTKELQQANDELEKKNKDLASFAYVSSHDLQEPLRKINTFISRIEDGSGRTLPEKEKGYFERIKMSATRMQVLINDLLSFSRIDTTEIVFAETDLNVLVGEVLNDLDIMIQKANAVVHVEKLPTINIVAFQFHQLFVNLVTNAIKFSRPEVTPEIYIKVAQINGNQLPDGIAPSPHPYYHFTVTDNGIGFEPQYSERIFEVFQRLHGRREYEGTGIGLAICKKIVENHRGYIKAEGRPDAGATFHIYIPMQEY